MPVDMAALVGGFALLAPVYTLLFKIQRQLGGFETRLKHLDGRVERNEREISNDC